MYSCELCGSDFEYLIKAKISNAELSVCPSCTKHGEELGYDKSTIDNKKEEKSVSQSSSKEVSKSANINKEVRNNSPNLTNVYDSDAENVNKSFEDVHDLCLNFGEKIKKGRNEKGWTRKELSKKLGIKESHLKNLEKENLQPEFKLQTKLENILGINLEAEDFEV